MATNQLRKVYQAGWDRISFQATNSLAWPNFAVVPLDEYKTVFHPIPDRWKTTSYVDHATTYPDLHKNCVKSGYEMMNKTGSFAFPSLLFPNGIIPGYGGFIEVITDDPSTVYSKPFSPYSTGNIGCCGLGQIGETICVDPLVTYTDSQNETYYLLGNKKICGKTMRMIVGGGMMDPNLDIYENMVKEIQEEGLKGKKVDWLGDVVKKSNILYAGYLISSRCTDNRWTSTVCSHVELTEEQALSLKLESDVNEDCTDPHWFPKSQLGNDDLISPMHKLFITLSEYDKVRYCQLPNPFWSRRQLEKLRSCMNNLGKGVLNLYWAHEPIDEQVYFIAGPTNYDRVNLWLNVNKIVTQSFEGGYNKVIIDPINGKMHRENRPWLEALEHWHIDHKDITTVFVMPKDYKPNITFLEMQRIVQKGKKNVMVFIQNGFSLSENLGKIPEELLKIAIWYDDDMEVAEAIAKH